MENKQTNNVKEFSKGKNNGAETHVTNEHDVRIAEVKYDAVNLSTEKSAERDMKQMEFDHTILKMELEIKKSQEERKSFIEEMKQRDDKSLKKTKMITDTVSKVAGFGMLAAAVIVRSNNITKINIAKIDNGITE